MSLKTFQKAALSTFAMAALMANASVAKAAVLANVGEKMITEEEIKKEYESSLNGDQRRAINEDVGTRRNLVDNAVNTEVLVMAAKKAGLEKDEEYQKALERFQKNYLATRFMQKAIEPKLTRGEIKKFFEENKTFFDTTQVCASHIIMTDEKEALKVLGLAKTKGVKFEDLAKKHSADPTVQENKGNLGCFNRDKMVPEFAAAAFDMRKNEIKGPVRTMYGFHIIKLNDIKAGKVPGFDEIEQKAKETYRLKLVTELLQDLRKKSNVKVNDEEVKKFKL